MGVAGTKGGTGQRYNLGSNKGVFDEEMHTIYRVLRILTQRQESGQRDGGSVGLADPERVGRPALPPRH